MWPVPPRDDDLVDGRFWFIGWIALVGEPEEWDVLDDSVNDRGKLHAKLWLLQIQTTETVLRFGSEPLTVSRSPNDEAS
jgi:hypothetical protein